MLKNPKAKKRRPTERDFPVLIGVPVPNIDHKINSGLSIFMAGCSMRRVALPYGQPSRDATPARNNIIETFLHDPEYGKFTHLLFMDADCCPVNPFAVERLLSHQKDVVAGITPILITKDDVPALYWNCVTDTQEGNLRLNRLKNGLFKAERVGGTAIMVHRRVLEKLETPYQKSTYNEKNIEFIQSEDYYFCEKIRQAGFDIWIDPSIMCSHWHTMDMLMFVQMISKMAYAQESDNE